MLSMFQYFTNVPKHKLLMTDMERRGAELFKERVMIFMNGDSNGSQTIENTHEIIGVLQRATDNNGNFSTTAMTAKLATAVRCLWRTAMFGLFCYFEWLNYTKYAENKIATASTNKQRRYQKPFSISLCPVDYRMPKTHIEMVTLKDYNFLGEEQRLEQIQNPIHFSIKSNPHLLQPNPNSNHRVKSNQIQILKSSPLRFILLFICKPRSLTKKSLISRKFLLSLFGDLENLQILNNFH